MRTTKDSWEKNKNEIEREEMKVLQLVSGLSSCGCSFISPTVHGVLLHIKDH